MILEEKTTNILLNKSYQTKGLVINNKKISNDTYKMVLECSEIANICVPGQFISVLSGSSVLLRRPFSIANAKDNNIEIIYKLRGKGTRYLTGLQNSEKLDLIGPLGKGFSLAKKRALLVGAGVGIAPILYLRNTLEKLSIPTHLLAGFKTSLDLPELMLPENLIITEDGSSKHKGTIINYLENEIQKFEPEIIYACGPEAVLQFCVKTAEKYNLEVELALEKVFACGIGVCMGCVVQVKENNEIVNKRICKDGPVFEGRSIIWQ